MTSKMIQTQGLSEETMMLIQKKQGIVTILGDTYTASASSLRRTLSADMSSKKWVCPQNNDSSPMMKKIASSEELLHHHPKTIANLFSSSSSEGEEEDYEERKKLEAEAEAEAEAERERLEIWSSIQRNKKEEQEKSGPFDTWGSIMSLKGNNNNNNNLEISKSLPVTVTPYAHPLVKRSKSSLSEKSLEICTESLGSETGSDGLLFSSSYPPSESGESEVHKDKEQQQQQEIVTVKVSELAREAEDEEWLLYNNHASTTTKNIKSPPRSFPPPLPSLSFQANNKGTSLHMRPHRDNGRLVLEAVSLPSMNNFNAQRQDGRLVLTFANDDDDDDEEEEEEENYYDDEGVEEELEEEFEGFEKEEEEEEDEYEGEYDDDEGEEEVEESEGENGDVESVTEKAPLLSSGIIPTSVQRLALMMNNKPIGLVNRNPNWSEKFNNTNLEDVSVVEMEPSSAVAQSLPPRPRVARLIPSAAAKALATAAAKALATAAASSFNLNAYEYYWKTKPTAKPAQVPNPLALQQNQNSPHKNNNGSKVIVSSGDMNQVYNEQQQLLVLRGKNGDYLVHNLKSCKDSRRPFLFWEPYCIATS